MATSNHNHPGLACVICDIVNESNERFMNRLQVKGNWPLSTPIGCSVRLVEGPGHNEFVRYEGQQFLTDSRDANGYYVLFRVLSDYYSVYFDYQWYPRKSALGLAASFMLDEVRPYAVMPDTLDLKSEGSCESPIDLVPA